MKKFLPFLILFFLVILIGAATYQLSKKRQHQQVSNEDVTGQNSDVKFVKFELSLPDFSLPDLFDNKQDFSKRTLVGNYSLINFFASWCSTCVAEHEVLLNLQKENIIDIYGVAWRDIDRKTKSFLNDHGNPYKKIAKDGRGLFYKITGIIAIPETLLVDPEGNVVMRYRGNLQNSSINEIKEFLNHHKSSGRGPVDPSMQTEAHD